MLVDTSIYLPLKIVMRTICHFGTSACPDPSIYLPLPAHSTNPQMAKHNPLISAEIPLVRCILRNDIALSTIKIKGIHQKIITVYPCPPMQKSKRKSSSHSLQNIMQLSWWYNIKKRVKELLEETRVVCHGNQ